MSRRLTTLILRALFTPTAVAAAAVLGLAVIGVAARLGSDPLVASLPADSWPTLLLALLVPLLSAALPLAVFAGAVAGVARLESDGAVDAARALGARPWQLAAPTVALGLLAGVLTWVAGAYGEPWGRHRARHTLAQLSGPDLRPREGPLVLASDREVLGAAAVEAGGVLIDVLLWRADGDELVVAPRGRVSLGDGTVEIELLGGESHLRLPDGYVRARFGSLTTSMPLRLVSTRAREPFELMPGALVEVIRTRRDAGQEVRFHQLALHRRVATALAVPLLVLLAWPLGRSREGYGAARGVLLALGLGLGYYLLLRLSDHALREFHWSPVTAAYLGAAGVAVAAAAGWVWRWSR
ncbi:MAG: LptF/LptG family permease [Myxococcota bacterium]|nr:LptF/LptG family permease [Myxococcota bacterium]